MALLIFYEPATKSYPLVELSQGTHVPLGKTWDSPKVPALPKIGPETRNAFSHFSEQKQEVIFFAFFHTHPNFISGESRDGKPSGSDIQYQSDYRNVLGIIRTGKGYSCFSGGRSFGPEDPRANECIVDLQRAR